ncbi:MAG: hypothetical protein ACF8R7_03765 [Phycisphaerales bacterium JB039]
MLGRSCCFLLVLLLAALATSGCASTSSGDTTYRVNAPDQATDKLVRRELWRVSRAIEDVRVSYGLRDIDVEVIVTDLDGLGAATPQLTPRAEVRGARLVLNYRLFTDDHPELDLVLHGLAAHELAHALHYANMSTADLAELGLRYDKAMRKAPDADRPWVRAYEQLTDMTAIALGYGDQLIWQKRASAENLARNDPPFVWDFYLTEEEIRSLNSNRDLLTDQVTAALDTLKLPSLRRLRERIALDEEGDVIIRR